MSNQVFNMVWDGSNWVPQEPISSSITITADTEFVTAAALNGTWAKTTVSTISGAAAMVNDGTNLVLVPGDTTNGMLVNLGANNDVVVSSLTVAAKTNSTSTAVEDDRIVKASAGTLYGGTFTNANASTRFIQFHDSASAPADTAVPVISIPVQSGQTGTVDFGLLGRSFATGIYVCASTTQNTKTIAGNDHLFDVQYT